jgi:ABC-type multidrug transport system ATPase subunit
MNTCPVCDAQNPEGQSNCQQCGQILPSFTAVLAGETVQARQGWKTVAGADRGVRRSIALSGLFSGRDSVVIGRYPESDILLPHPVISRAHAELSRRGQGLLVRDLNSINGVFLNGRRVREPSLVRENDHVGVGPYMFVLQGERLLILDNSQSLRLQARNLEKIVRDPQNRPRQLLDNISLVIEPGEFVCLLGPSGSGKSTLMDCLNGRRPASGGLVLANGENFYQHYRSFRQSLGYVPQQDIVHTQLTVYRALLYTAKLRLPLDTEPHEMQARINAVVQQMELVPHQQTLVRNLSGGQIKRVSLGAELIARPCLLYIDEATSGLDAGTETRMMRLFRTLAEEGKSVICITHNVDNVDLCHLILVLMRGKLVWYGPPADARAWFGVSRTSEIYDRLAAREPADWEREFRDSEPYREFVEKRLKVTDQSGELQRLDPGDAATVAGSVFTPLVQVVSSMRQQQAPRLTWVHQLRVLTQRNLELIWRDKGVLRLLVLQAPVVALFILLGFANQPYDQKVLVPRRLTADESEMLHHLNDKLDKAYQKYRVKIEQLGTGREGRDLLTILQEIERTQGPVVPREFIINPTYTYMLLFLCVIVVLWFGCNNAAKEIVKEDAIYSRERAVNLGYVPYLSSKFLVWSGITALQTWLYLLCVYGPLEYLHWQYGLPRPQPIYQLEYPGLFGVFALLAMAGVALGLLLSACVRSPDKASTLLPYVLIPQIILGGGVLVIRDGPLFYAAAVLSPAYWAYRAGRTGATSLPAEVPVHMDYYDSVWLAAGVLLVQIIALLLLTAWFLRQKDVQKK